MSISRLGDTASLGDLATVVALVRSGTARTRPELARLSGLGRKAVTQRVDQLVACGLFEDGPLGRSTGGRSPRELLFRAEAGCVLVCELNSTVVTVGLADLSGQLLIQQEASVDVHAGAESTLPHVEQLFDQVLCDAERRATDAGRPTPRLWGVGMGVLGPVDAAAGRPVALTVPGWGDYPVRDRLEERYRVPVWLDNEVNLMALGEFRGGLGRGHPNLIYLKLGHGIGAGLVSGGRLHRGAHGIAGEVGHIAVSDDPSAVCPCGNVGCLNAVVGGSALARAGTESAVAGHSEALARLRADGRPIEVGDVVAAAASGDTGCIAILAAAGERAGRVIAMLVNAYNPSLVLIGGEVAAAGDLLLASIRQTVYRRALPLATRNLQVTFSPLSDRAGLVGAAFMVLDDLFSPELLLSWIEHGSPAGRTVAMLRSASAPRVA
jgi:glucokinase-like ROK family protein